VKRLNSREKGGKPHLPGGRPHEKMAARKMLVLGESLSSQKKKRFRKERGAEKERLHPPPEGKTSVKSPRTDLRRNRSFPACRGEKKAAPRVGARKKERPARGKKKGKAGGYRGGGNRDLSRGSLPRRKKERAGRRGT